MPVLSVDYENVTAGSFFSHFFFWGGHSNTIQAAALTLIISLPPSPLANAHISGVTFTSTNVSVSEQSARTGVPTLGSSDLEFMYASDSGGEQIIGIRFGAVNVSRLSDVMYAHLQVSNCIFGSACL
jgi:hypothetical protein